MLLILFIGHVKAQSTIFQAVRNNDTIAVYQYIHAGKQIDTLNEQGYSLLTIAAYNNSFETTRLLLDHGASTVLQDRSGNTALMGVCFRGYTQLAGLLLAHHADPNLINYNQANALFFAATFGHTAIVKMLLKYKVNTQQKDRFGKKALDYALLQENEEIAGLLK